MGKSHTDMNHPVDVKFIIYSPGLEAVYDSKEHNINTMTFMQVRCPSLVSQNYSPFTSVIV